jgi:hypothetical protein
MELGDIHLYLAWQAWHLATSTFVWRGRHGTYDNGLDRVARLGAVSCPWRRGTLHPPSFGVAGVALGAIHLRLAWQAWHLLTSTFCVAGMPIMTLGWIIIAASLGHLFLIWSLWPNVVRGHRNRNSTSFGAMSFAPATCGLVTLDSGDL